MSRPRDVNFDEIPPTPQPEPETPRLESREAELSQPSRDDGVKPIFANRFVAQDYHPVILIGSANAGKTVLLLSLLSFFKSAATGNKLGAFFGEEFFKLDEDVPREMARQYFDLTVAKYMGGESAQNTKIDIPMFIPVRVTGEDRAELKFAFMESNGEKYQPSEDDGERYYKGFMPDLESLLRDYPDGISFIWVAPYLAPGMTVGGKPTDVEKLLKLARGSLQGAFQNYEACRAGNAARDTHMFLVTKWDTHVSEIAPADIRINLDRRNDHRIGHEVENFIKKTYPGAYGGFQALKSPGDSKVVFRYSAGTFNLRARGEGISSDLLLTYPRDIWNWLYNGMRRGHDWNLPPGPLVPTPPKRGPTLEERFDAFFKLLFG